MKYKELLKYEFMAKPNQELHSHSQAVLKLFKQTFDGSVLSKFIEINFRNVESEKKIKLKDLFFSFLCDLAYYHDFGKALFGFKKDRLNLELNKEDFSKYQTEKQKNLRFNVHPINSYFYLLKIGFLENYFNKIKIIEMGRDERERAETSLCGLSFIIIYHHTSLEDLITDRSISIENLFNGFDKSSLEEYLKDFNDVVSEYLLNSKNVDYPVLEEKLQYSSYLIELKMFFELFKYAHSCLIFSDEYISIYGNYTEDLKFKDNLHIVNKLVEDYINYALELYKVKISNNDKLIINMEKNLGVRIKGFFLEFNGWSINFEKILCNIFSEKEIRFEEDVKFIENIIKKLKYDSDISEYHLQIIRNLILLYSLIKIRHNIENDVNISYLELPTGIGKTNISIGINLLVMKLSRKQKSFYVFPTINIIEQSYRQIKERLPSGDEYISKIYSKSSFSEIPLEDIDDEGKKFVIEKTLEDYRAFNYLINIVSQVNLLETFFNNRKASNIRLCNLNNSCIVLDEIQTLPERYWFEIAEMTSSFSQLLNIHFVFMSATLPKITNLIADTGNAKINSIFDDNPQIKRQIYDYFSNRNIFSFISDFPREKYLEFNKHKEELNTYDKDMPQLRTHLSELFENYKKGLIVVNTVNFSLELYDMLKNNLNVRLLNSTILPFKKVELLSEFKKTTDNILLISTQTIESGVDIDADFAIREYSPISSISQIGGRVNREFKKQKSPVYIYNFKGDYSKIYKPDKKKYDLYKQYHSIFDIQNSIQNKEFLDILNNNLYFSESDNNYLYNQLLMKRQENKEGSQNSFYLQYKHECLFRKINQIKIIDSYSITVIFKFRVNLQNIKKIDKNEDLVTNKEIITTFKELYYKAYNKKFDKEEINTENIYELNKSFRANKFDFLGKKVISKKLAVLNDYFGCKLNFNFYSDQLKSKLGSKLDELFEDTYFVHDKELNDCFNIDLGGVDKQKFFKLVLNDFNCLIL